MTIRTVFKQSIFIAVSKNSDTKLLGSCRFRHPVLLKRNTRDPPTRYPLFYLFFENAINLNNEYNMTNIIPFPSDRQAKLLLPGPAGQLEVMTTFPETPRTPLTIAVICHPHPLLGGTLHNKVIYTLARCFNSMGLATVRFNFRGVGQSQGEYDKGHGESDDLLALLAWLKKSCPGSHIWLAGFSFGAYIAARVAKIWPVKQLICVAPPIENFPFKELPPFPCPWLVVQGDEDEVVSPTAVFSWLNSLAQPPEIIKIQGASHFFHGKLIELRDSLSIALNKN